MKGLSPDEREVIKCLRAIDDEDYRKRFLLLLMSAGLGPSKLAPFLLDTDKNSVLRSCKIKSEKGFQ